MFRHVPGCSGMFRNVPCSGFYRRPPYPLECSKMFTHPLEIFLFVIKVNRVLVQPTSEKCSGLCSTPGISSVLRGICRYSGFSSPFVYSHKAFYNLHMSLIQWTPRHIWAFAVQEGRLFDLTILLSGEVSLAFRCNLL